MLSSSFPLLGVGGRLVEVASGDLGSESQSSQPPNALGEDQPGLPESSQPPNAPRNDQPGLPEKRPQRDTRTPRRYPETEDRCAFVGLAQEEPDPHQPSVASVCFPAPSWVGLQPLPGFATPPPGDRPLPELSPVSFLSTPPSVGFFPAPLESSCAVPLELFRVRNWL